MEKPSPGSGLTGVRGADYLLLSAIGCLWFVAATFSVPRAYHAGEYVRLVAYFIGCGSFILIISGALRAWYARRHPLVYFLHLLLTLTVAIVAMRARGPVWLLILPAASQAVMFLRFRQTLGVLAALLVLTSINFLNVRAADLPTAVMNVLASFLFTIGCSYVIRRERDSRRLLHEANEQLHRFSEQVQSLTVVEERNRLAREIHDGAAHHLTAAHVLIEAGLAALSSCATEEATDSFRKALGQNRAALAELRMAVADRTGIEPKLPLIERVRALIRDGRFDVDLSVEGPDAPMSTPTEHALYRVAQETLTNARKHAPGAKIALAFDFTRQDRASLIAENNEPETYSEGDGAFGLLSLRERIQRLGGTFQAGLDRTRGRFVVTAEVPR